MSSRLSSAKSFFGKDKIIEEQLNYLIDLLSVEVSQELTVGGEKIKVTMSPRVGFEIKNLTTDEKIFYVDSTTGDGKFSGDVEINGKLVIGGDGVLSLLQFESTGNPSWGDTNGWGDFGLYELGGTIAKGFTPVFINVPSNFTIEKATVILRAMPVLHYDVLSTTYTWKQSRNLKLYQGNGNDGYAYFVVPGGESAVYWYSGADVTNTAFGVASWSPALQYTGTSSSNTDNKIQSLTGDVTSLITAGTPTTLFVQTTDAITIGNAAVNQGLGKVYVIVEGYATASS